MSRVPTTATALYAGGVPLAPRVAEEASRWYVLFMSGSASEADRHAWEAWRHASPDHERAWTHLTRADARLDALSGSAAYNALSLDRRKSRRRTVLAILGAAICGTPALWAADRMRWVRLSPDYESAVGQQRTVMLADGTTVLLNTDTAIDAVYEASMRRVRLRQGEILVSTGHESGYRGTPFLVETAHGRIRALGTRFTVRDDGDATTVGLLDGNVEIEAAAGGRRLLLQPGQIVRYNATSIEPVRMLQTHDTAWVRTELAADNMRLDQFLAELSRYRPGLIFCDSEVGGLRISGLFPLSDTDKVLAAVARLLPVTVSQRTPYWVHVSASL